MTRKIFPALSHTATGRVSWYHGWPFADWVVGTWRNIMVDVFGWSCLTTSFGLKRKEKKINVKCLRKRTGPEFWVGGEANALVIAKPGMGTMVRTHRGIGRERTGFFSFGYNTYDIFCIGPVWYWWQNRCIVSRFAFKASRLVFLLPWGFLSFLRWNPCQKSPRRNCRFENVEFMSFLREARLVGNERKREIDMISI